MNDSGRSLRRRTFLALVAGTAAAGTGLIIGRARRFIGPPREPLDVPDAEGGMLRRVTGPSMAPTLRGGNLQFACPECRVSWAVHRQPSLWLRRAVICWNCGASVPLGEARESAGDIVQIEPDDEAAFTAGLGDMVAVRLRSGGTRPLSDTDSAAGPDEDDAGWSIKRVAATPGRVLARSGGILTVDDCPALNEKIWLPVHDDAYRPTGGSRWRAEGALTATARGFVFPKASPGEAGSNEPPVWLVYHHLNVYNRLRPEPVGDDVPYNATEMRRLMPVRRLRLTAEIRTAVPTTLQFAFWDGTQTRYRSRAVPAGDSAVHIDGPLRTDATVCDRGRDQTAAKAEPDGERWTSAEPPDAVPVLTADRPAAIALPRGDGEINGLLLRRPVEYRIDDVSASQLRLPYRLGEDEYFLLGDNEPLSIDSRTLGPIPREQILGRVFKVSPSETSNRHGNRISPFSSPPACLACLPRQTIRRRRMYGV